MNGPPIVIVGCGPGAPEYLTDAGRRAAAETDVLLGSGRLLDMFPEHAGPKVAVGCRVETVLDQIAAHRQAGRQVAVLVSGDPGVFSLARSVTRHFGRENCRIVPGISSVQVALARLGLDAATARLLSAHGRTPAIDPAELGPVDTIVILAGNRDATAWIAEAAEQLRASHVAFLCENLTLPGERVRQMTSEELAAADAVSLALVVLVRKSVLE